jgi:hypothetical protein
VFADETIPLDVPRLGKVLLLSTSSERRAWAARALGATGRVSAYAYLRKAFWDPDEQVRASAVAAVGQLAVSHASGELAAVYAWSGPRVRREVLRAVTRMAGSGDFAGILFLASGDADREVRALGARASALAKKSPAVQRRIVMTAEPVTGGRMQRGG